MAVFRGAFASLVVWGPVSVWALSAGCGGSLAPDLNDGGGAGPETGAADAPISFDAPTPFDAPVTVDAPTVICQVDGVPCFMVSQCCTGICADGVCGGTVTPSCVADGDACASAAECCSGACTDEVCAEAPPASCAVSSSATPCDVCVAESCCSEESTCQSDAQCVLVQMCFDQCHQTAGDGAMCAQKCLQAHPSSSAEALFQCASTSCLASCE